MSSCYNKIINFEFDQKDIKHAVENGRLLSMEIEFSLICNFRCQYCYVPNSEELKNELTNDEIRDLILQAKELGARKIIILGGEPMLYPNIFEMMQFIKDNGMAIEMFTNGTNIDKVAAKKLFDYNVTVVLKLNSFKEDLQDKLAGVKGAYKIIWEAFHNLKDAGYPSKEAILGISTVICNENFDELLKMWQWIRDQKMIPYFEMITPQGRAKENDMSLEVDSQKVKDLFFKISEIDKKQYGQIWDPQPPLVGNKCLRHQFSCVVNSRGFVMPCVGVTIPVGNVRETKLSDILKDSEVIQNLRNYRPLIKEPCQSCKKVEDCYGCRGAAYQLTGDYLASDPLCWHNIDKQKEIVSLPIDVKDIIPQKFSMRLVDRLLKVGERVVEAETVIKPDNIFLDDNGFLDEAVYVELIAQSFAAGYGFLKLGLNCKKVEGFLLGAKKIKILHKAKVKDHLKIVVVKQAKYGDFGIVKGEIFRNDELLASGEIKLWNSKEEQADV